MLYIEDSVSQQMSMTAFLQGAGLQVDAYDKNMRTAKYAILVIALTFLIYFFLAGLISCTPEAPKKVSPTPAPTPTPGPVSAQELATPTVIPTVAPTPVPTPTPLDMSALGAQGDTAQAQKPEISSRSRFSLCDPKFEANKNFSDFWPCLLMPFCVWSCSKSPKFQVKAEKSIKINRKY